MYGQVSCKCTNIEMKYEYTIIIKCDVEAEIHLCCWELAGEYRLAYMRTVIFYMAERGERKPAYMRTVIFYMTVRTEQKRGCRLSQ